MNVFRTSLYVVNRGMMFGVIVGVVLGSGLPLNGDFLHIMLVT